MKLSSPLARLFPAGAVVAELRGAGDPAMLLAEEIAVTRGFAAKRIAEFAAGRACARRGLHELGYRSAALLPNGDRTPRWPDGIVGSITHTEGYCAAVVAGAAHVRALGIDAEIVGGVTAEMWSQLFTAADLAQIEASRSRRERAELATIVFSAKEAFYKCQYAITRAWVDFEDVTVHVERAGPAAGTFTVRTTHPMPVLEELVPLTGRYAIEGDIVITGAAVPPGPAPLRAYPPIHRSAL